MSILILASFGAKRQNLFLPSIHLICSINVFLNVPTQMHSIQCQTHSCHKIEGSFFSKLYDSFYSILSTHFLCKFHNISCFWFRVGLFPDLPNSFIFLTASWNILPTFPFLRSEYLTLICAELLPYQSVIPYFDVHYYIAILILFSYYVFTTIWRNINFLFSISIFTVRQVNSWLSSKIEVFKFFENN